MPDGLSENETGVKPGISLGLSIRDFIALAVGFGCLIGFARMASLGFVGYLDNGFMESTDTWYELRTALGLGTLIVIAIAGWRQWFKVGIAAVIVATAAAVVGVIVFAFDADHMLGPLPVVLLSCSMSVLMYVWLMLLSTYGKTDLVMVSVVGLIIAGAIVMGVPRIDSAAAPVIAAASAFFAGMCVLPVDPRLESCKPDGPLAKEQAFKVPWFTIVAFAVSGFIATFVYGIAEQLTWLYDWKPNYIVFGIAAVASIVATFGMILTHDDWKRVIWAPQMLVVVLALALSCFSLRETLQGAVGFMLAAVFCSHYLHWVVFPSILAESGVPRSFLAGIMLILVNGSIGAMAGSAIGSALPHSLQNLGGVAGLSVIALVVVLAITHFVCRMLPVRDTSPELPSEEKAETLESRIEKYRAAYGLTPRESEVALLTAQGFTCSYIAEKLVVSNSTVRFHQQNLYRKVDVHSRNEFIERATSTDPQ